MANIIQGLDKLAQPLDNIMLPLMLIWTIMKISELKNSMMDYMVSSAKEKCKDCGSIVDKQQCTKCYFLEKYDIL